MQIEINSEEKLLQRRKFYVRSVVILMVLLLFAFNFGSWLFHNKMGAYLEAELSKRLSSLAKISARNIELTPGVAIDDLAFLNDRYYSDYLLLQSKLRSLQVQNDLEGAYIIDNQLRVLIDASANFPRGTKLTHIQNDSTELMQAWIGNVAVSPIHLVEGNRFKTAYAPITNIMGDFTTVLVLEANADFFNIIRIFRRGLIIGGLTSIGAIILFSLFLSWTIGLLINTQQSLRKTEKLALLGQMAASVAHEIRNPLGIIKATADVVKMKYENKNEPDELFDFIGKEVMRLNNLVNDFLSFARETKLNKKESNIIETLEKATTAFERECEESHISISMNIKSEIPTISYDDEKIQQVLYNLLTNAAQSIENGGEVKVEVDKYVYQHRHFVEIKIIDNGCGIEGDVQKIFEPFFTTKSSGSGLGLAITKQIIEKHDGWIAVKSEKGVGTMVRFYLPMGS